MKKFLSLIVIVLLLMFVPNNLKAEGYINACSEETGWTYLTLTDYLDNANIKISKFYNVYTGKIGFCIQPDVFYTPCNGGYYKESYPNETVAKIVNAYEALGNRDDYYIAAQLMIWESMGYYYTINGDNGYNYGRGNIEYYISNNLSPKSVNLSLKDNYPFNEEITIKDTNSVINNYNVFSKDIKSIKINNNSLYFTIDSIYPVEKTIEITPINPYSTIINSSSFVYKSSASQSVYSFEGSFPLVLNPTKIKVKHATGNAAIKKVDEWGRTVKENIIFRLFDKNDKEILKEDGSNWMLNNGEMIINGILPEGKYYLIETHNSKYEDNDEKIYFEIEIGKTTTINISNINKSVSISYIKTDMDNKNINEAKFELYDITENDTYDSTIKFIKINQEINLIKELLGDDYPLFNDEDKNNVEIKLDERFARYYNNGILNPKEYGYFNYDIIKNGVSILKGKVYVGDNSFIDNNIVSISGNKLFEGFSGVQYLRSVDYNNHNNYLPNYDITVLDENNVIYQKIKTDNFGLYDVSEFEEGIYYYYIGEKEYSLLINENNKNKIDYLKTNRKYLLCESNPANGYEYNGNACEIVDTYEEEYKTPHFYNNIRTYTLKLMKESDNNIKLNGARFNLSYIDNNGKQRKDDYISGGFVVYKNSVDDNYLMIEKDGVIYPYAFNDRESIILMNLKEGKYKYYLSKDKVIDNKLLDKELTIVDGGFEVNTIPYNQELILEEVYAPSGYYIKEKIVRIKPYLEYSDITLYNHRINYAIIDPPKFIVPETCSRNT